MSRTVSVGATSLGALTSGSPAPTLTDLRPSWHDLAACKGAGNQRFFQEHQAGDAKRVCGGCPVLIDCLEASVSFGDHDGKETHGIWGGIGAQQRRLFRRLRTTRPHDDPHPVEGCGCAWCAEVNRHLGALDRRDPNGRYIDRAPPNSNGPNARHGRRATQAKGCRCGPCLWSASKSAQALAKTGVDTATWWSERYGGWNVQNPAVEMATRLVASIEAMVQLKELRSNSELALGARRLAAELEASAYEPSTPTPPTADDEVLDRSGPDFYSADQVADRWNVAIRTVRTLTHDGHLPSVRLSPGVVRIRRTDLEEYEARAQEAHAA